MKIKHLVCKLIAILKSVMLVNFEEVKILGCGFIYLSFFLNKICLLYSPSAFSMGMPHPHVCFEGDKQGKFFFGGHKSFGLFEGYSTFPPAFSGPLNRER